MEWFPELNFSEEHDKWLSDIELRKVKQLKASLRQTPKDPKRAEIEKEIYQIYLNAVQRNKKEEQVSGGLKDWLDVDELASFNELKEKIKTAKTTKLVFRYEAMLYEVYLNSINKQTDFKLNVEVRKYIDMMKECETEREAKILSTVIVDLLRTAR